MVWRDCIAIATVAILLSCPATPDKLCLAHPFHTSLTEMDWNSSTGCWEVGLRVFASDLELVLRQYQPKLVLDSKSFDKTETRQLIQMYLQSRFFLTDSEPTDVVGPAESSESSANVAIEQKSSDFGTAQADAFHPQRPQQVSDLQYDEKAEHVRQVKQHILWVGHEIEGSWIWLYFELVPPTRDQEMSLVHQILIDINDDQINTVSARNGKQRISAQMHRQRTHLPLNIGTLAPPK